MTDYFMELENRLNRENSGVTILDSRIVQCESEHQFDLFAFGISEEAKYIYNHYKSFLLSWEDDAGTLQGYVEFVPYVQLRSEHEEWCEIAKDMEAGLIEEQDTVVEDFMHWYPIFRFANGDAFCYDDRNGRIVFLDHEVFDEGINLHGLTIAENIDTLLKTWSRVLFADIYDWYEGVCEYGIDLSKPVYERYLRLHEKIFE